ncbi:hypothetical protein JKG68_23440 [Microvirga aerilata]|jgi:hypothetical protein|uniref:Uncharacterized protein n=1 Tax=Microvirga aerilata TaxID=670292 RepID=A0A936ZGS5_9HYPH|nr:hypothetical protein [Microvirga aerilata]MBL0406902.1 hypothetical protein [Microvirga aerilata]
METGAAAATVAGMAMLVETPAVVMAKVADLAAPETLGAATLEARPEVPQVTGTAAAGGMPTEAA